MASSHFFGHYMNRTSTNEGKINFCLKNKKYKTRSTTSLNYYSKRKFLNFFFFFFCILPKLNFKEYSRIYLSYVFFFYVFFVMFFFVMFFLLCFFFLCFLFYVFFFFNFKIFLFLTSLKIKNYFYQYIKVGRRNFQAIPTTDKHRHHLPNFYQFIDQIYLVKPIYLRFMSKFHHHYIS